MEQSRPQEQPEKPRTQLRRTKVVEHTVEPRLYVSRIEQSKPVPDIIVADIYRIKSRIGNGSFGELFRAVSTKNGDEVAVKLESANAEYPQLPREAKIYNILSGGEGFSQLHHFGTQGIYNVLVLDLLGPTLEDLLCFCSRQFSLKTTLMLADQILARVEHLHINCLLHRDIKPENFLMGLGPERNRVFMIDFGLAKKYYSPCTREHISYGEKRELVGTARYASLRAHYAEQGRRDDMESVGFLLLYFLRGQLPWQGVSANTRQQKYEKIFEMKSTITLSNLCNGAPIEFYKYIKYCRCMEFTEEPDYLYVRQLFRVLFRNRHFVNDKRFDWVESDSRKRRAQRQLEQQYDKACEFERHQQCKQSHQHKKKRKHQDDELPDADEPPVDDGQTDYQETTASPSPEEWERGIRRKFAGKLERARQRKREWQRQHKAQRAQQSTRPASCGCSYHRRKLQQRRERNQRLHYVKRQQKQKQRELEEVERRERREQIEQYEYFDGREQPDGHEEPEARALRLQRERRERRERREDRALREAQEDEPGCELAIIRREDQEEMRRYGAKQRDAEKLSKRKRQMHEEQIIERREHRKQREEREEYEKSKPVEPNAQPRRRQTRQENPSPTRLRKLPALSHLT